MTWLHKSMAVMALGALLMLRIVDLAVFDAGHDHVDHDHAAEHASELVHHHGNDDNSDHSSDHAMTAHVGFHTLLSVLMTAPAVDVQLNPVTPPVYEASSEKSILIFKNGPPVPPPLA